MLSGMIILLSGMIIMWSSMNIMLSSMIIMLSGMIILLNGLIIMWIGMNIVLSSMIMLRGIIIMLGSSCQLFQIKKLFFINGSKNKSLKICNRMKTNFTWHLTFAYCSRRYIFYGLPALTPVCTLGRVYTLGPELHKDLSTLQSPVLHLDVFALQEPDLHLDRLCLD
jgi:hypothetical protein